MDFESIGAVVVGVFIAMGLALVGALIGGTLVWLLWPVLTTVFPGVVAGGWIAGHLPWWEAVCFTWIVSLLVRPVVTTSK